MEYILINCTNLKETKRIYKIKTNKVTIMKGMFQILKIQKY